MRSDHGLEAYCQKAVANGATHALVTEGRQIITAPWALWRCQFGCTDYGKYYSCPPCTPTIEQTRQMLDSYNRVILLHLQWSLGRRGEQEIKGYMENVVALEQQLELDGFYRAFSMLTGRCLFCKECALTRNHPCSFPKKARPAMEGCGIDIYQTAHRLGLPMYPLRHADDVRNIYCLVLVD